MLGALTQGVNFNCNASICFGIGPVHEQFKALQTTINRFAQTNPGFAPLVVDGFIGDKTVAAANAAVTSVGGAAVGVFPPGNTREAVATNALALLAQLQATLQDLEAIGVTLPGGSPTAAPSTSANPLTVVPPPLEIEGAVQQIIAACRVDRNSPTCGQAKVMCAQVRGTAAGNLPDVQEICSATKSRVWIFLLVGGAVAAAGVGAVVLYRRHHARSPHELGARRRKRRRGAR